MVPTATVYTVHMNPSNPDEPSSAWSALERNEWYVRGPMDRSMNRTNRATPWCTAWLAPVHVGASMVCAHLRTWSLRPLPSRLTTVETWLVVDASRPYTIDDRKAKRHLHGHARYGTVVTDRRAARDSTLFPGPASTAVPATILGRLCRPPRPLAPSARRALLERGEPHVENVCGALEFAWKVLPSVVTSPRAKAAILCRFPYQVHRRPKTRGRRGDQFPNTVQLKLPRSTATVFFDADKGIRLYFTGASSPAAFEADARYVQRTLVRTVLLPTTTTPPRRWISTMLAVRYLRYALTSDAARRVASLGHHDRDTINLRYVPCVDAVSRTHPQKLGFGLTEHSRKATMYGAKNMATVRYMSSQLDALFARVNANNRPKRKRLASSTVPAASSHVRRGTHAWSRRHRAAAGIFHDGRPGRPGGKVRWLPDAR